MEKICRYIQTLDVEERNRLARQRRGELDCAFLDKENNRCAIYPVRPWICEAFGRVEGMRCPKMSGLVQIIPKFLEDASLAKEYETGVVGSSANFDWRKIT